MVISLIVPVYLAEPWIDECMASIRAQTYKDIELIRVDDPEGTGAAAARNRGLDKATGEYVAFCDADDYLAPDAIEKMVAAMNGVDMVCGSFRKFGKFDAVVQHETKVMSRGHVAEYAMRNLCFPMKYQMLSGCWAKLYRRRKIGRFPALTSGEDLAFNFEYLMKCKEVRFISDIVYHNRKRDGSLTTTFDEKNKKGLFGFLEALGYVRKYLGQFYPEHEVEFALDNSKAYHSALYFMRIMEQTGKSPGDTLMRLYA